VLINPNEVYEKLRLSGEEWAEADYLASLFEETRRSLKSKLMVGSGETSVAKAEMVAEANDEYREHIKKMVDLRRLAIRAKVKYDSVKAWVEMTRTLEASNRAQMNMR